MNLVFDSFLYSKNEQQFLDMKRFFLSSSDFSFQKLIEKLNTIFASHTFKIFWEDSKNGRTPVTSEDKFQICLDNHQTQDQVVHKINISR